MNFKHYVEDRVYKNEFYKISTLTMEGIITPENVKIHTTDINRLNIQHNPFVYFYKGKLDELVGFWDENSKKLIVTFGENITKPEIEAIVAHELIHKIQHQKTSTFYKETKDFVYKLNNLVKNFNKTPTLKNKNKFENLENKFRYSTTQEKMAYAYQYVKLRQTMDFNSPSDIINYFKQIPYFGVTKQFKKYIGMYWLIKERI